MDHASIATKGVNILDPKQLLHFAQDTSEEGRMRLAGAVSQFFDEKDLTETEQHLATEILLNLIRQAEIDLRQALADRLAVAEKVPQELIVWLANDEISVARPLLLNSSLLNDVDLMYIISSKSNEYWQTIAQRKEISPMVANKLIETADPTTCLNLLDNQRVSLQKSSMKKLVRVALVSEELQAPLLRRPEVDADIAVDLYMVAAQSLRREIVARFSMQNHVVDQAMDALVHEFSSEAHNLRETTPQMTALAAKYAERNAISPDLMIRTLRRGQVGFFTALFAEKIGMTSSQVTLMIQQDGGKPFVVACKAMRMMKSEFASIFLLSRGIRTGDKIVDQRELAQALKYFDALKDFDVERIIKSWARSS